MSGLVPKLDTLPEAQRALWPELAQVPRQLVLYGGTALALRLGHRASVDFDFFSHDPLDHHALEVALPWLSRSEVLQEEPNARTVLVARPAGKVKVSLFGNIAFGRVGEPELTADGMIRVASLLDLAGTKIKALLQRVEAKDYLDIAAMLRAGLPLGRVLGAARTLFGPAFNPLIARKTLTWFECGDLSTLPSEVRRTLLDAAIPPGAVEEIPRVAARLD